MHMYESFDNKQHKSIEYAAARDRTINMHNDATQYHQ